MAREAAAPTPATEKPPISNLNTAVPTPATVPGGCPGYADILEKYKTNARNPGDINEHVPVVYSYASGYERITELGSRTGVSTWGFALAAADRAKRGEPVKLRYVDLTRTWGIDSLEELLRACPGVDSAFIEGDDLVIPTWPSDVLHIDTCVVGGL